MERTYGSFSRSFTLPTTANVDKIKADLSGGVLTIELPKARGSQPRKISLNQVPRTGGVAHRPIVVKVRPAVRSCLVMFVPGLRADRPAPSACQVALWQQ